MNVDRFNDLRSLLEKNISSEAKFTLTPSVEREKPTAVQYFLVQVNQPGSENLLKNSVYEHLGWENTPRDAAHGEVKPGDLLIVYFAKKSIEYKKTLKKIYSVDSVSPDRVTFRVTEVKNLQGIPLKKIIRACETKTLSNNFEKLGQQGFNIRKISQSDYDNILLLDKQVENAADFTLGNDEDLPVPTTRQLRNAIAEIKNELFIDESIIKEMVYNLLSGRNILLTGPIGTGKTHLAGLIPEKIWQNYDGGYYPEVVTATSDWTTTEVIGGISPNINESDERRISYDFIDGCVTRTVKDNWAKDNPKLRKKYDRNKSGKIFRGVWLIIDEFNRANIDKCFGEMFTALEYRELILPSGEFVSIPKDYRIIATLNVFDKHFLFNLSDALKRRFAFVEISSNFMSETFNEEEEKYYALRRAVDDIKNNSNFNQGHSAKLQVHFTSKDKARVIDRTKTDKELLKTIDECYQIFKFIRFTKNLGTGILISMIKYVLFGSLFYSEDRTMLLDSTLKSNIIPQLESFQKYTLETISSFCTGEVEKLFSSKKVEDIDFEFYETEFRKISNHFGQDQELRIMIQNQKVNWSNFIPWTNDKAPRLPQFVAELSNLIQNSTGV